MAKNRVKFNGALTEDIRLILNHNFADVSLATAQLDAVTGTTGATLTNVAGMVSDTLEPGQYKFKLSIDGVTTANAGQKMALKWGTAAMITAQTYSAKAFTASGVVVTYGSTATDATLLMDSATGVVIRTEIEGVMTVALAGTLQFQMAQHTAHADTTSVYLNSKMEIDRIAVG